MFRSITIIILLCFPSVLKAETWEPVSKWSVDNTSDKCQLERTFKNGDSRLSLAFRQDFSLNTGWLFLKFETKIDKRRKTKVLLNSTEFSDELERVGSRYNLKGENGHVLQIHNVEKKYVIGSTEKNILTVDDTSGEEVKLSFGNVEKAKSILEDCQSHLLDKFGFNYAELSKWVTWPKSRSGQKWFQKLLDHYPAEARRLRQTGLVKFMFVVDSDGKVGKCSILTSSGHPILDKAACPKMDKRKASFFPARDQDGKAMAVPYVLMKIYTLDKCELLPPETHSRC